MNSLAATLTLLPQVVGALGHLRRVATQVHCSELAIGVADRYAQVENVAAARKTAAVTALFSLALVDDRRCLLHLLPAGS